MKIIPSLDEVLELARSGQYRTVPLSCEILSDICTPIEALRILKNRIAVTAICSNPSPKMNDGDATLFWALTLSWRSRCLDGKMHIGDITLKTDHPSDYLRQILSQTQKPALFLSSALYRRSCRVFLL